MVDWQPLLAGSVDGLSISVGGACVGDTVNALPFRDITQVFPNTPPVRRKRGHDAASDAGEDASRDAVTQGSPLEEVRRHGGYVHTGKVAYEVAKGLIRKIWVRGPFLKTLPFTEEADIERLLGPSTGLERKLGWVIHHYPERSFSVGWHAREGRIEHVALGVIDWVPPTFGARQVLREWLEGAHAGLAPDWQEPPDRATAQWVRHARVLALLRAFELGSPKDFADGSFLKGKALSTYPRAAQVLREAQERGGSHEPDALGRLFWWLLLYREQAEKLLQFNSGWLVASHTGLLTALQVTGDANEGVAAALEELEALLVELIEPSEKQVTERELIERWGWPEVDLDELLMDEV
ncbi:MAG: hypothetical protein ACJ8AT_23250 [Hyalangium sp.]|uniref:hypothetical protein n=1 Tax=Hyalangium sp. TaxID=2028555 RepID=UPI00389B384D